MACWPLDLGKARGRTICCDQFCKMSMGKVARVINSLTIRQTSNPLAEKGGLSLVNKIETHETRGVDAPSLALSFLRGNMDFQTG